MKDSFVYIWKNKHNGKKYIGYHKGSINDGYVSSTSNSDFWIDFKNNNLIREIIFRGTCNECLAFEQNYLKSVDLKNGDWYNRARGSEIIFTQDVKDKIKNHHLGGSSGMKNKRHSLDTKEKIKISMANRKFSEDHLQKLRKPNKNKGKKGSDDFKKMQSSKFSDHKMYTFFNIRTKEYFIGTRLDFAIKFNIKKHNIKGLITNKTKVLGNEWILES